MNSLDFTLSLIDNVTQPLKQAQSALSNFANESQKAFTQSAIGVAGLAGALFSLKGLLDPALQMNEALQTASLQGVDASAMKNVTQAAMKFSAQYGKSSVEFTQSALTIRKAIQGVADNELPYLTTVTNTTATALKSTADETTAYMGQMFSQFSTYANQVGKSKFAEELAGKALYMSQAFGTSMADITGLMEGARSAGTHFGVGIDEQLAVLGELQRTLGSEASSAYEGFMTGAADGAKKLGLSFVDASGKMNSLPEMLGKLQQKYGANIDGNLKAQKEIEAAFGDSAIVVKQLYGDVDVLRKNITALGANDGMKRTREMAEQLADPWERLMAIWTNVRVAVGMTLLPVITPLVNKIAEMGQTVQRWLTLFPNIAKYVGYIATSITGVAAAGAMANIVMGISKFIWAGLVVVWKLSLATLKLISGAVWLANKAMVIWQATLKLLRGTLLALRMAAITAGIGFNLMSLPIILIIGAIALLGVGIYYLIKHWDAVKAAIQDTTTFKVLAAVVMALGQVFSDVWEWIGQGWENLCNWFGEFSLTETFEAVANSIRDIFGNVWAWVKETFADIYNSFVDTLNYLPGVEIERMEVNTPAAQATNSVPDVEGMAAVDIIRQQQLFMQAQVEQAEPITNTQILTGKQLKGIDKNGIGKNAVGSTTSHIDNSRNYENVVIKVETMPSPQQLTEYEMLAHG
ncbi:phage tail tape measure protein [Providencia rettgeri]|uniref:Phage tail tape measure protein n=1 Tax=Providencia rettgeri TaxID=587 RepID=A0AAP2JWV4_PRORE|nr:phage tail tape measure protein [Providencia rettgeri]EMB3080642.1 phage tail tape measure protein [Providencia rettgeri]MBX6949876.1 phage tail tape measure protein [Providencia rettgeri]MBX6956613.1 phage tail tape measure protein [Providencia rettgeri]MBX6960387.1 phage tail tape measure protein [Providencia rettgeri]MBX6970755.1 phage tail tape measure protein [Providencia rettgeri]